MVSNAGLPDRIAKARCAPRWPAAGFKLVDTPTMAFSQPGGAGWSTDYSETETIGVTHPLSRFRCWWARVLAAAGHQRHLQAAAGGLPGLSGDKAVLARFKRRPRGGDDQRHPERGPHRHPGKPPLGQKNDRVFTGINVKIGAN